MGSCVGSYLNVVIYRLPLGMSTNQPKRSFCPNCKYAIPFYQNIPIVTWIIQGGKCSNCKKPIAVRYLVVELMTGLIWLGLWWYFTGYKVEEFSPEYLNFTWYPVAISTFYILLFTIGLVILVIDVDHMIIPLPLTIIGGVIALIGGGALPLHLGEESTLAGLGASLLGGVVAYTVLWMVVLLGKVLFGKMKISVDEPMPWSLREAKEDSEDPNENLALVLDGEDNFWHDLFFRKSDKLFMSEVSELKLNGDRLDDNEIFLTQDRVTIGGVSHDISMIKSLSGKVKSLVIPREAMGMGDVHLIGVIGLALGVNSLLLIIIAACFIGILIHLICKAGFGKQLPFAPSLLLGAVVWIFFGERLLAAYATLF